MDQLAQGEGKGFAAGDLAIRLARNGPATDWIGFARLCSMAPVSLPAGESTSQTAELQLRAEQFGSGFVKEQFENCGIDRPTRRGARWRRRETRRGGQWKSDHRKPSEQKSVHRERPRAQSRALSSTGEMHHGRRVNSHIARAVELRERKSNTRWERTAEI
jgi:hypothetical protein